MVMHKVELDGAERMVCRNCVDKLQMGGNTEKFKKVGHSTFKGGMNQRMKKNKWRGECLGVEVNRSV